VAYGDGSVWVANSLGGTVSRIDPQTGSSRLIRVGNQPTAVAPVGANCLGDGAARSLKPTRRHT
jgi:DNA-binding beta-propeller fold protein YncE